MFGQNPVVRFCHLNRLYFVTRSHQLVMDGIRWYFRSERSSLPGRLVNIWSAPNYAYTSGNKATVMMLRFPGRPEYHTPQFSERDGPERIKESDPGHWDYFA
jgi:hypothetical protein